MPPCRRPAVTTPGGVWREPGCRTYALHETDDRLVLVEVWESDDALDTHLATPALAAMVQRVTPLLAADIDIVRLEPVEHDADPAAAL